MRSVTSFLSEFSASSCSQSVERKDSSPREVLAPVFEAHRRSGSKSVASRISRRFAQPQSFALNAAPAMVGKVATTRRH